MSFQKREFLYVYNIAKVYKLSDTRILKLIKTFALNIRILSLLRALRALMDMDTRDTQFSHSLSLTVGKVDRKSGYSRAHDITQAIYRRLHSRSVGSMYM